MELPSIILTLLLSSNLFGQSNWYVDSQNGNNTNNGISVATAVKSVKHLTINNLIQPSDTIFIIEKYHNPNYNPNFSYGGNSNRNNPHIWHKENSIK